VIWRPRIEIAAAACRGTVSTFRQNGIRAVVRKLRRRLGIDAASQSIRDSVARRLDPPAGRQLPPPG
jgi:hypothetical protein